MRLNRLDNQSNDKSLFRTRHDSLVLLTATLAARRSTVERVRVLRAASLGVGHQHSPFDHIYLNLSVLSNKDIYSGYTPLGKTDMD